MQFWSNWPQQRLAYIAVLLLLLLLTMLTLSGCVKHSIIPPGSVMVTSEPLTVHNPIMENQKTGKLEVVKGTYQVPAYQVLGPMTPAEQTAILADPSLANPLKPPTKMQR